MKILAQASEEPATITPEGAQRRILSYGGGLMLVEFTFAADVSAPIHSHPNEQVGYVVAGEIDLIMEGHERTRLTAGGSYYVAPNVRHGIVTYAPTVVIDCFTPIREDFLSVSLRL
jgi:quercetin dioxygenase-like cupin family protein